MDNLQVRFPKKWLAFFSSQDTIEQEIKEAVIAEWVRLHKISQGKGAELLGMDRWSFYDLLSRHNVPTVDLNSKELEEGDKIINSMRKEISDSNCI